jgi:hypothetical protein
VEVKLEVTSAHCGCEDVLIRYNWQIIKVLKNIRNRLDLVCIDAKYLPEEFQTALLSNNGFTGVFMKWDPDEKNLNIVCCTPCDEEV